MGEGCSDEGLERRESARQVPAPRLTGLHLPSLSLHSAPPSQVINNFCNATFRQKLRDREGMRVLGKQIALDFVVLQPLVYWPCYYTTKELVKSGDELTPEEAKRSVQ